MRRAALGVAGLALASLLAAMCGGGSEPARLYLPVSTAAGPLAVFTTDTGYAVQLDELRVTVADLEFTVNGEAHARARPRWSPVARAYAHPGHLAGGEVTGQLLGDLLFDFVATAPATMGPAELLEGDYQGMNLRFRQAGAADGLGADDPVLGHGMVLAGRAMRGTDTYPFRAVLDLDTATKLVGVPCQFTARAATSGTLVVRLLPTEPTRDGGSLLDGVDFAALQPDGSGVVAIGPGDAAHDLVVAKVQDHAYWWVDFLAE